MQHRPRGAAAAQPHPAVGHALQDAERADLRQRRLRRRSWTGRWRWPTGTASRRAAPPRSATASCAASASAASSRSPAAFSTRPSTCASRTDGKVALRTGAQAMGQGHLSTFVPLVAQTARHRPERGAAGPRRQRRGARRHAERRLALDHDGGQRHRARLRPGDRQGPARRRAPARGRRRRHRVRRRHVPRRRHRPRHLDPRAGAPHARDAQCRRISPAGSTTSRSSSRRR